MEGRDFQWELAQMNSMQKQKENESNTIQRGMNLQQQMIQPKINQQQQSKTTLQQQKQPMQMNQTDQQSSQSNNRPKTLTSWEQAINRNSHLSNRQQLPLRLNNNPPWMPGAVQCDIFRNSSQNFEVYEQELQNQQDKQSQLEEQYLLKEQPRQEEQHRQEQQTLQEEQIQQNEETLSVSGLLYQLRFNMGSEISGSDNFDQSERLAVIIQLLGGKKKKTILASEFIDQFPEVPVKEIEKNSICSICQEEWQIGDKAMLIGCMHRFHPDCILLWLKNNSTCPECNQDQIQYFNEAIPETLQILK